MQKIFAVEDDPDLLALLKYNLETNGFQFAGTGSGAAALQMCCRERPDLILLDILLPDADGFELCRQMRANSILGSIPIFFVTARANEADRVVGLELGANDYVVKPFSMRELLARIRVHFRPRTEPCGILRVGAVELDRQAWSVHVNGRPVELTATEFRLLDFLMARQGGVFTRAQLLDAVWGLARQVTERTVDVCVLRVRRKLGQKASSALIRNVRGMGYTVRQTGPDRPCELPHA